tara:strand:+ start:4690 stop:5196 length:507 start_codon:yes stop_codon:yes gene_type:complete
MTAPLMPKATAAWLLDNTTLTFKQIAEFCELHPLEIQSLADGDTVILGVDPVASGQIDRDEIAACETNESRPLALNGGQANDKMRQVVGARYTPVAKRQDKPDAVAWILRNHGNFTDAQIIKLIGTTKNTIEKIRDRSHWNMQNIRPRDPVEMGLCSQADIERLSPQK